MFIVTLLFSWPYARFYLNYDDSSVINSFYYFVIYFLENKIKLTIEVVLLGPKIFLKIFYHTTRNYFKKSSIGHFKYFCVKLWLMENPFEPDPDL